MRLGHGGREISISVEEWNDPELDLLAIDRRVHAVELEGAPPSIRIHWRNPTRAPAAILEIATRYQRLFPRTNAASNGSFFARVLELHRSLYDLSKPLVRADHEHAIDTWQWMLCLDPRASLSAQIAALFHDVERLVSEADARIEHLALDYRAFKDRHAATGAAIVGCALRSIGAGDDLIVKTARLVEQHERSGDAESALLSDADSLSFFSLNSAGFLAYFGPEHTAKKVRWTLARMSRDAKKRLDRIRLPRRVRELAGDHRA